MLGRLQGFNRVDVYQRTMHGSIIFGVPDDDAAFESHHVFRVAHFMALAVGKPHTERLKRPTVNPFKNRFHVHATKFTTGDSG